MTRATVTTRLEVVENTLPSWLPAVGERGSVSLNTMYDTRDSSNPDGRLQDGTRAILSAWTSTTYASTLGRYGSILAFGGGHADGAANSVHRYDIETRLWTRICGPDPIYVAGTMEHAWIADTGDVFPSLLGRPTSDLWGDPDRTTLLVGKLSATHTYGQMAFISPDMVGNVNGWLFCAPFGGWWHYVDLDRPAEGWKRTDTPLPGSSSYGVAIADRLRKRVLVWGNGNGSTWLSNAGILDCTTLGVSSVPTALYNGGRNLYNVGFHSESSDLYLTHSADHRIKTEPASFSVMDPVAQTRSNPTTIGTAPSYPGPYPYDGTGVGTLEWVESDQRLAWWSGIDETMFFLAPTGNLKTDPWEWTSQTFTGDTFVPRDGNCMFKRLHWVEELGSFFIVARHNQPVQCWRVR